MKVSGNVFHIAKTKTPNDSGEPIFSPETLRLQTESEGVFFFENLSGRRRLH